MAAGTAREGVSNHALSWCTKQVCTSLVVQTVAASHTDNQVHRLAQAALLRPQKYGPCLLCLESPGLARNRKKKACCCALPHWCQPAILFFTWVCEKYTEGGWSPPRGLIEERPAGGLFCWWLELRVMLRSGAMLLMWIVRGACKCELELAHVQSAAAG